MSVDTPADDVGPTEDLVTEKLSRNEGIQTTREISREPASHGFSGSIVINDADRSADEIPVDVGYRNLPNGSLYQLTRATWYKYEDEAEDQCVVLSEDYNPSWSDREDRLAVILSSSRWRAGRGEGDDYTPWYKYDLKIRQIDEDGDLQGTPAESLNVKIQPQSNGLVHKDGEPLTLPFGEGTLLNMQTTWIESPDEALDRTLDLLEHVLGYEYEKGTINPESRKFWKAEAHQRFDEDYEDDVVHTIRQSTDLLANHAADVDERAKHQENRWLEIKIVSTMWEQLGFPDLDVPILLKVYYPDNETAPYPLNQPKIEAALAGNPSKGKLPWDRFDEVLETLREIVCTHLKWADVGVEDLVSDDFLDGAAGEQYVFAYPHGRRTWLRNHYESLVPEIYREATKANTTLVYDILDVIRRRGKVTYQDLQDETGAAYRTVREHVRRLEEDVGGDEPGVLQRVNDWVTFVGFSSRVLEDEADDVLDEINPDDTPEDRRDRADARRERRRERRERREQESDADPDPDRDLDVDDVDQEESADLQEESNEYPDRWRYFNDVYLTGEQLGRALERGVIEGDDVRIRTGPYDWFD